MNGLVTVVGQVADDGASWRSSRRARTGKPSARSAAGRRFAFDVNLSKIAAGALVVRTVDAAGNTAEVKPQLTVNTETDIPVAQIQVPADGELLRDDFVLSGMVFDDDGVQAVWYRIDNGEFQQPRGREQLQRPALPRGGLRQRARGRGEGRGPRRRHERRGAGAKFKVSRSDPVSSLSSPRISDHLRDIVELKGTSRDPNGIAEVRISFDNGLSFNRVAGTETWPYRLDTRLLADGTQAVLVRAVDATGAEGLYTTTINIDNHAPELVVDSPADGEVFADRSAPGRQHPGHHRRVRAGGEHHPHGGNDGRPEARCGATVTKAGVLAQDVDIAALAPGWYNLQIEAADRAGNKSYVSRNFVKRPAEAERVEILYPAAGEQLAGPFAVSGRVLTQSATDGKNVVVLAGGQPIDTTVLDAQGYFRLVVKPQDLTARRPRPDRRGDGRPTACASSPSRAPCSS